MRIKGFFQPKPVSFFRYGKRNIASPSVRQDNLKNILSESSEICPMLISLGTESSTIA